jgi:hypothetical protein
VLLAKAHQVADLIEAEQINVHARAHYAEHSTHGSLKNCLAKIAIQAGDGRLKGPGSYQQEETEQHLQLKLQEKLLWL